MTHPVSEPLPDDALKAIFESLERPDLGLLALTNVQFCNVIVPMLDAKANELLRRIPPTLERYRRIVDIDLPPAKDNLQTEENRLVRERYMLNGQIHLLETAPLKLYGAKLARKLEKIDQKMKEATNGENVMLWRECFMMPRKRSPEHSDHAQGSPIKIRVHRLKAEFHQANATNLVLPGPTAAHGRLAEFHLRAEDVCRELRGVLKQFMKNYIARGRYESAHRYLRDELELLRRGADLG